LDVLTTQNLLAFLAVALVIIVIPGPSVVFTIGRALVLGSGPAVLSVLGNVFGVGIQILAVAFGAGAILAQFPTAFFAVKILGALFLVYLGIDAFRHRLDPIELAENETYSRKRILSQSFVVGITNPKTIVFFLAAFPQFVSPGENPVVQMLFMGLIFSVIGFFSDSLWALAAGTARHWFGKSQSRLAALRGGGGVSLSLLGIYMAYEALKVGI
jgi:threonine/homoserine/homoserine lactone efflux protein